MPRQRGLRLNWMIAWRAIPLPGAVAIPFPGAAQEPISAHDTARQDSGHDPLLTQFRQPPQAALPRMWWQWLNGNVTQEGITADLEWMHRVGIGGVHYFDAGGRITNLNVVDKRTVVGDPQWQAASRHAATLADRYFRLSLPEPLRGPWYEEMFAARRAKGPTNIALSELRLVQGTIINRFLEKAGFADGQRFAWNTVHVNSPAASDATFDLKVEKAQFDDIGEPRSERHGQRVTATLKSGAIAPGGELVFAYGTTTPWIVSQAFPVRVDVNGKRLSPDPTFAVEPGPATELQAIIPSAARPGEPFRLQLISRDGFSKQQVDRDRMQTAVHHSGVNWGGADFDGKDRFPRQMRLIEIYSAHGQSEYYDPADPLSYENARSAPVSSSLKGRHYVRDAWAGGYKLCTLASSDDHNGQPAKRANGLTAIQAPRLDRASLLKAMAEGHVYGATGERILLDFSIAGQPMGSVVEVAKGKPMRFSIETHGTDELSKVSVYRYIFGSDKGWETVFERSGKLGAALRWQGRLLCAGRTGQAHPRPAPDPARSHRPRLELPDLERRTGAEAAAAHAGSGGTEIAAPPIGSSLTRAGKMR
ncbi:glycosyl hydrolase [Sphingobium sp. JS3065]|uniref:glycosyl hydrolase n=1 Tax=Sphingobium sp. JS3065 TaxID=2970925 RepID=UPI002263F18D|nr:glycosyl hydrolase [Sphingobium sp. JS3065]UZW57352.1 glycosyl hydrolase [Sphingobium sp. JS3065]